MTFLLKSDIIQINHRMKRIISKAVDELSGAIIPHDTVIDKLNGLAEEQDIESDDLAIAMATYMLGFGSYKGFVQSSSM